ncbi:MULTISPECIES: SMC-Scp complex subunit ScpB [Thalassospira]|jgi:segregation and condensation protein B|uniref:Segregation and condensation protein B n=1 Tax=Thalassospira xiamenensis TaxID=220697 RepID=A0ABR5XW34_9PROT|nr:MULTISPECIES: SMC-Scp complex subunit ScpB [Thalassospira]MBL4843391.1 SMC-Scp complex subunit ScpB [Thalassospira sp.]MBR9778915.1 SMC-Scp complex subunit ScpB [Rhodospirillales bacterium]KZC97079.1 segregation and condensation protein B [Thalassospira xiamenensis]KZD08050.1 segregation and condensation protein B [Thalassospira xiamenensis]MBR9818589.1 SMC-Scp complex subunit ScpB [Rhodospirillales bacterium]|tara:strand:+ start:9923 stop:10693 length:771 start_codon:yes stop_codon:yes gene_type:complete
MVNETVTDPQFEIDGIEHGPQIDFQHLRIVEAVLFASAEPVSERVLAARLPEGSDVSLLLEELQANYSERGINLNRVGEKWAFRTAADLAGDLHIEVEKAKKMTRATLETLAIIAYHEPVTRSEIEEIRGVALSKGTLDILLEAKWIRPKGRKRVPGRPVLWATTDDFLDHFGLEHRDDLPGLADLKAAGLLDSRPGMGRYGASSDEEALPDLVDDGEVTDAVVEEALTTRNLADLDETIYSDNPNLEEEYDAENR